MQDREHAGGSRNVAGGAFPGEGSLLSWRLSGVQADFRGIWGEGKGNTGRQQQCEPLRGAGGTHGGAVIGNGGQ